MLERSVRRSMEAADGRDCVGECSMSSNVWSSESGTYVSCNLGGSKWRSTEVEDEGGRHVEVEKYFLVEEGGGWEDARWLCLHASHKPMATDDDKL